MSVNMLTPLRRHDLRRARRGAGSILRGELYALFSTRLAIGLTLSLLILPIAISAGFAGVLVAFSQAAPSAGTPLDVATLLTTSLTGVHLTFLIAVIMACVLLGGELSSGVLATKVVIVPGRASLLLGKLLAGIIVTALPTILGTIGALASADAIFTMSANALAGFSLLQFAGSTIAAALSLITGFLLGTTAVLTLRSTAGSIAVTLALLLFVPGFLSVLPFSWAHTLVDALPSSLSAKALGFLAGTDQSLAETGWAMLGLLLWSIGLTALSVIVFRRQDL